MAGSPSDIQKLRTRLEKTRWQLHDGLLRLEDRLHIPESITESRPVHNAVQELLITATTSLVMLTVLPRLMKSTGRPWVRSVLPAIARVAIVAGVSLLVHRKKNGSSS